MHHNEGFIKFRRNALDAGFYIEKYFPAHDLRFVAINDGYDSANGCSGGIMVSLKNLVNKHVSPRELVEALIKKISVFPDMRIDIEWLISDFGGHMICI